MIPVLTPAEMGEVDRTAPEPVEVLVRRAAGAVARTAVELLGQAYGARVVVVAPESEQSAVSPLRSVETALENPCVKTQ